MRPTVQVGNPFLEKVLIEACLEVADTGYLEGMQDLGAAGLTSSAIESASKGNSGIEIDISLVPRREQNMTAYEVMLSESQERMLLVVAPENVAAIKTVMEKWDVVPENINFGVKSSVLEIFLQGNDVDYDTGSDRTISKRKLAKKITNMMRI